MTGGIPVRAEVFEEAIDGYFPLRVSLGHLLARHGFCSAWVVIRVAPIMDVPGLAREAPVPLKLDTAWGGQADWLAVCIAAGGMSGRGIWRWTDPSRRAATLPEDIRLAEPAFVRGIGFFEGDIEAGALGSIASRPESKVAICSGRKCASGACARAQCWPISGCVGIMRNTDDHRRAGCDIGTNSAKSFLLIHMDSEENSPFGRLFIDGMSGLKA
ncbi:hypothetical protein [Shimia abyssi]|uniref:Uncharacterized protein n=1 Tax=Shimia abyssi TaxID=1662395 RepID=A0A2P8F5U8_9RHOB|nr:hypothetical protein [Shimia abyssi]PSL17100.1 hypothetical protein CLV88_12110 [Shimia abyssi]